MDSQHVAFFESILESPACIRLAGGFRRPVETTFGSLLYDARGELVLHGVNKTWLYTTFFEAPRAVSATGAANGLVMCASSPSGRSYRKKQDCLGLADGNRWAVIHDVNIMYENRLASGHWGKGIRIYKIRE
jgi:hypothetical protein